MTVAELREIIDARFASQGKKIDDLQECVHAIQIGIAKRSGTFAVLSKFGLILIGAIIPIAGALIISAL